MTLETKIREAAASGRLSEIVLRESFKGWQAVAKFHGALGGPWNVGCDPDPVTALQKAFDATPAPSDVTGAFD